ncbi:MAG: SUMF1/EgtB/PvdO family nonheme iron enzyme [Myxococcota bacterium]|nr:SUMF1/EgtB/PvdO family nonheme iron enzyme [Myxococcota bacterium]
MICYKCGSFTADGERKCSVCGQLFASDRRRSKRPATAKSNSDGPFPKGQILGGRYVMEGNPTASASGWTYRAKDQKDNVWVAVKVIDAKLLQTESERSKFVSALKKASKVSHPCWSKTLSHGTDRDVLYYITPFVEGLSLRKIIDLRAEKRQVFSLEEALPTFRQLANALSALKKGDFHGAITPQSLRILPETLKISGLAHLKGLPRRPLVAKHRSSGSYFYLAPEVRDDSAELRSASDVFSAAVILTEMLTGIIRERDGLEAWERARDVLDGRLAAALERGFGHQPDRRFDTVQLFLSEVEQSVGAIPEIPEELVEPDSVEFEIDDSGEFELSDEDVSESIELEEPTDPSATPLPTTVDPSDMMEDDDKTMVGSMFDLQEHLKELERKKKEVTDPEKTMMVSIEELEEATSEDLSPSKGLLPTQSTPPVAQDEKQGTGKSWLVPAIVAVLLVILVGGGLMLWLGGEDDEPVSVPLTKVGESQNASDDKVPSELPESDAAAEPSVSPATASTDKVGDSSKPNLEAKPAKNVTAPKTSKPSKIRSKPRAKPQKPKPEPTASNAGVVENQPIKPVETVRAPVVTVRPSNDNANAPILPPQSPVVGKAQESCPAGMVMIDAGPFWFGTRRNDPLRGFNDREAQNIDMETFCVDRYEFPNKKGTMPRVNTTWAKARAACQRAGKRLCTEEEWERACKGPRSNRFPVGNRTVVGACNVSSPSSGPASVAPAGAFSGCKSAFGIVDMSGNVAEWTASSWKPGSTDKVVKGGSALQENLTGRCSSRINEVASRRSSTVGFRCCRDPR